MMMESNGVCPGRTWQSMKQRWDKYISRSLDKFKVSIHDLDQKKMDGEVDTSGKLESSRSSNRGIRSNANYFSDADDRKILGYIIKNKRYKDTGGKSMWQVYSLL